MTPGGLLNRRGGLEARGWGLWVVMAGSVLLLCQGSLETQGEMVGGYSHLQALPGCPC